MDRKTFLIRAAAVPIVASIPPSAYVEGGRAGVTLPALRVQGTKAIHIGYKQAVTGYEYVYPTLYAATRNMEQATNIKIEWDRDGRHYKNYLQIFRNPYSVSQTELSSRQYGGDSLLRRVRLESFHQHLADVEKALVNGVGDLYDEFSIGHFRYSTLTGTKELFRYGRIPRKISLYCLRDLCLIPDRQANDFDGYTEEFLGEITLKVENG